MSPQIAPTDRTCTKTFRATERVCPHCGELATHEGRELVRGRFITRIHGCARLVGWWRFNPDGASRLVRWLVRSP